MIKRVLAVCLLTMALAGCGGDSFVILFPQDNSKFLAEIPEEYRIQFEHPPTSIMLNGVEVVELFTFEETEAWVDGDKLKGLLKQGHNAFAVEPLKFGPRHSFRVDNKGPDVVILELPDSDPQTIRGKLVDPSGARTLTLNGIPVAVDSRGEFLAVVPNADVYTFVTEDDLLQQATHRYAARDMLVEGITKIRIDEKVFDDITPFVQELVEDQDLAPLLEVADADTLFNEKVSVTLPKTEIIPKVCIPVIGCTPAVSIGPFTFNIVELKAKITSLSFDELDISQLDLESGFNLPVGNWEGLALDATISGLDVGLDIKVDVLSIGSAVSELLDFLGLEDELDALDGDFETTLAMPSLRFDADLGLNATNGEVDAQLVAVRAIGLGGANSDFDIDIDLPSEFNDFGFGLPGLVVDAIEAAVEGTRDVIVTVFLETLVPLIANLIIEPLFNQIKIELAASLNNGALITVFTQIETINVINNDSSLLIGLNGRIGTEVTALSNVDLINAEQTSASASNPLLAAALEQLYALDSNGQMSALTSAPTLAPRALGFRYVSNEAPNPDNEGDLGLVISSNIINQAFLALHEAGLLGIELNMLSANGEFIFAQEENANRKITLEPSSPPEFGVRGDQFSIAFLTLNHYKLRFQRRKSNGEWSNGIEFDFSVDLPINIGIDNKEGVQISLLNPDFNTVFHGGPNFAFDAMLPKDRPRLITAILPALLEDLETKLWIFLPDNNNFGFIVEPGDLKGVGNPKRHLSFNTDTDAL